MNEPFAKILSEKVRRKPGRRPQDEGGADDTRRDILTHALHLFNTRGYAAVSIEDITSAAGISKPTFYYHFQGKAEALVESLVWLLGNVQELMATALRQPDRTVYERLQHLVRERRAFIDREHVLVFNQTMMDEALSHLSWEQQKRFRETIQGFHAPLRGLMVEGIASGELAPADPDILAVAFRQLFHPSTYHALENHDPAPIDTTLLEIFYRGAAAKPRDRAASSPSELGVGGLPSPNTQHPTPDTDSEDNP